MTIQSVPTIAKSILLNEMYYAYNPLATYKGHAPASYNAPSGGLLINYQYNDPTIINVQGDGIDNQVQYVFNHDALTCARYLQSMAKYLQIVPDDAVIFENSAFPNTNKAAWIWHCNLDFIGYNPLKSIPYWTCLEAGKIFNNPLLLSLAHATAVNYLRSYRSGYFWTFSATNAHYSVNDTAGVCAAVLDAAKRWPAYVYHNPSTKLVQDAGAQIAAAKSGMDHLINVCRDVTYGLCFDNMTVSYDADGSNDTPITIAHHADQVNSRASTSTEVAEHLLRMATILSEPLHAAIHPDLYDPTHATTYQNAAYQMLDNLENLLWDTTQDGNGNAIGGYLFAVLFHGPPWTFLDITTDYKETRSTCAALRAYTQAAKFTNAYDDRRADCINALSDDTKFLKYSGQCGYGYVYRTNPDFSFYTTHPGQGVGLEQYITTEAMGNAIDALLSEYSINTERPLATDTIVTARNGNYQATARGVVTCTARNGLVGAKLRNGLVGEVGESPGVGGPT